MPRLQLPITPASSPAVRAVMQANRARATRPERLLREALRRAGRGGYRLNWTDAPGRPDISYPGRRVAIFVHGCFWHHCPRCYPDLPKSNPAFWARKFELNRERDARKRMQLERQHWRVHELWECDIRDRLEASIEAIEQDLSRPASGAARRRVSSPEPSDRVAPRAVVFDLGGVLIDWDPRHLYRRLFDGDEEQMERFLTEVTTQDWNVQQDRGRSLEEATAELVARHPDQADLIRAYYDAETWREMISGPIGETVDILAALRQRGVRLFALSNWSAETFPRVRHEFDFLDWFEGIVLSGHEGVTKPEEAIYRIMLDRHGLTPGETVFVDDSERNVEEARRLGMDAILFRGAGDLRTELERRGLLG